MILGASFLFLQGLLLPGELSPPIAFASGHDDAPSPVRPYLGVVHMPVL